MTKLETKYLGLTLKNPLVISASPLSEKIDTVKELEKVGASAVVMYSLFEEQITQESLNLDRALDAGTESFAEALSYFPNVGRYSVGPNKYLDKVKALKDAVDIPVIGSLNGSSSGRWIEYASKIAEAGADALEVNLYFLPTDIDQDSVFLEDQHLELVKNICMAVDIPVAIKLSPYFTSLPNMSKRFVEAGATGLIFFNRFYQPDLDLEELEVAPILKLSDSKDLLLPLRWIALLHGRIDVDFALSSGVHTSEDVIKAMMVGAKVSMLASVLFKDGIGKITELLNGIDKWMEEHEYDSIEQMQGSLSAVSVSDPASFERANYMRVLGSYKHLP